MQRALAPKKQVTEIARFVRQCGGQPKHSDILELVAHLNGAQNWNTLESRKQPEQASQQAPAPTPEPVRAGVRQVDKDITRMVFIGTTMFDEEEPWFLMTPDGQGNFERDRELFEDELEAIQREGVAVEALVTHPRTDRYGLPDVAITYGLLEWLHNEQGLSSTAEGSFELYSEDTGDDTPSECVLTVRIPRTLNLR